MRGGLAAVLPESWDHQAVADPVAEPGPGTAGRARIPDEVRHTAKSRLALKMIER